MTKTIVAKKTNNKVNNNNKKANKEGGELHVVKVKCLPFGFFEKELWGYFNQFGNVAKVRVARNLKTGNHKGWGYVGFDNKEVAEIAAETMDGYLMFEKKLNCKVMKESPKCMAKGGRYAAIPRMKGQAKKEAIKLNTITRTPEQQQKSAAKRKAVLKKAAAQLKAMGVDYDLTSVPSYTTEIPKSDEVQHVPQTPKTPKAGKKNAQPTPKKTKLSAKK